MMQAVAASVAPAIVYNTRNINANSNGNDNSGDNNGKESSSSSSSSSSSNGGYLSALSLSLANVSAPVVYVALAVLLCGM